MRGNRINKRKSAQARVLYAARAKSAALRSVNTDALRVFCYVYSADEAMISDDAGDGVCRRRRLRAAICRE